MLYIYICEDEKAQLYKLKAALERHVLMLDADVRFYCAAQTPHTLLEKAADRGSNTGIYFLDIDLKSDMNGLELAGKIREIDPRAYIVFITSHEYMGHLTYRYKVEAMDFIVKGDWGENVKQICACIETALKNQKNLLLQRDAGLMMKINGTNLILNHADIVMVQSASQSHKLLVHKMQGVAMISGSLKEYENKLGAGFLRCSQSTLLNLTHVREFHPKENRVVMDNGESCQVSLRMKSKFAKALKSFQTN